MTTRYFIILLLMCIFYACKEPVAVEFPTRNNEILVVDGFVTTSSEPDIISLRRSTSFVNDDIANFKVVANATVCIEDDLGNCTELESSFNGDYSTPSDFQVLEGSSYKLSILIGSDAYESEFETVFPKNEITDIKFSQDVIQVFDENTVIDKDVITYSIDFNSPEGESFALMDWEAVFEYFTRTPRRGAPVVCYGSDGFSGFSRVISPSGLSTSTLTDITLDQLNLDFKFESRHSLNAKLYTVSKSAFEFYSKVLSQRNQTGSVFDGAPLQIDGNIISISNPDEIVFGYFGAFNASEMRTFVNAGELTIPQLPDPCIPLGPGFPPTFCFDCTSLGQGASTTVPEFWQ